MYLEELILIKYVTVDPDIYNCSFIDIIDPNFIKSKFALSGTVNIHLPNLLIMVKMNKLSTIKKDEITKDKIEKVLMGDDSIKPKTLMLENLTCTKRYQDDPANPMPKEIKKIINKLDDGNYKIVYSIINLLGDNSDESLNYNVLIDVGSFLRNYENYEFALLVSHFFKTQTCCIF